MGAPYIDFVEWCDPAAARAERCRLDGVMRNPPLNERSTKKRDKLKYLADGNYYLYHDSEVYADQQE